MCSSDLGRQRVRRLGSFALDYMSLVGAHRERAQEELIGGVIGQREHQHASIVALAQPESPLEGMLVEDAEK